ncbi:MAG: DUF2029 domain-containing protein [Qipengyuania sp.]|nr:DUF2029 domain-containing protein [Qipengyuania sp.]
MGSLGETRRLAAWRPGALLVGLAGLMILGFAYREAMSPTGSDFLAFWGAGQVTAAGDPAAAYDLAVQERVQTDTGSKGWFAFVNPPPFLFAAAPLGLLSFSAAWPLWVLATYALWAVASVRAFPRLWPLVLAYPGALIGATHAQTGLLTGALLVFAATRLDRNPLAAGAAVGALIVKPHLALLMPFWLGAGGRWRSFLTAGATVLLLLALSALVFGPAILPAYASSWGASARLMREADYDFLLRMCSVYAPLRLYAGNGVGLAVAGVLGLATIAVAMLSWRRFGGDARASGAAVLAATALASPYLFNYDLPFLIVPTLWLVEQGLARGFRDYEKLGLVALWLAPYATRAAALLIGINPMPLASVALLALIWSRGGSRWLAKGAPAA